jgi:hypothetical protein
LSLDNFALIKALNHGLTIPLIPSSELFLSLSLKVLGVLKSDKKLLIPLMVRTLVGMYQLSLSHGLTIPWMWLPAVLWSLLIISRGLTILLLA